MLGIWCQTQVQRYDIALLKQGFERIHQLDRTETGLFQLFRTGVRIIRDDRHAEGQQTARQRTADIADTGQRHRVAGKRHQMV